jgi:hypothetical protein
MEHAFNVVSIANFVIHRDQMVVILVFGGMSLKKKIKENVLDVRFQNVKNVTLKLLVKIVGLDILYGQIVNRLQM